MEALFGAGRGEYQVATISAPEGHVDVTKDDNRDKTE